MHIKIMINKEPKISEDISSAKSVKTFPAPLKLSFKEIFCRFTPKQVFVPVRVVLTEWS